ncbi:hypothetical protein [Prosthecobacter fluviatilis]|uniref:Cytochrome c domain-containing protein n=1 Tax=Prosthecobacter fluviatilis TaxID=445931 RepID=A0ABW0KW70_9BACT
MRSQSLTLLLFFSISALSAAETKEPRVIDFRGPPHNYLEWKPKDRFAELQEKAQKGEVKLDTSNDKAFLTSLLQALDIPVSSQIMVFSASSLQSEIINPRNPRALYFNEDTYLGWVPGGLVEIIAADPEMGPMFYVFDRLRPGGPVPRVTRSTKCMNCHAGNATRRLPGLIAESLLVSRAGSSLETYRRDVQGHQIPLEDRFGGWHLTGQHNIANHKANVMGIPNAGKNEITPVNPGQFSDLSLHLLPTSDILPNLTNEHQMGFENRLVYAIYTVRQLKSEGKGMLGAAAKEEIEERAQELARYITFADEAKFPAKGMVGDPAYVQDFLRDRKVSKAGLSLKDLDLKTRMFKHRCSYMLYTDTWKHAPKELKERVYYHMALYLREQPDAQHAHIPPAERAAIRSILKDTLTDLPVWWR